MATKAEREAAQAELDAQASANQTPQPDTESDAGVSQDEAARLSALANAAPSFDPLSASITSDPAKVQGVTINDLPVGGVGSPNRDAYPTPSVPSMPTPVMVMPTEDWRKAAMAQSAREARTNNASETIPGGKYGVTDEDGDVAYYVDANGYRLDGDGNRVAGDPALDGE